MKKILTILLLLGVFATVQAQGNLQFNQVIYRELSFTVTADIMHPSTQITVTVPSGKVWKVEAAYAGARTYASSLNLGGAYGYFTDGIISINDRVVYFGGADRPSMLPIWLPSGTYTITLSRNCTPCYGSSNPAHYNGSISAIEFNVVP